MTHSGTCSKVQQVANKEESQANANDQAKATAPTDENTSHETRNEPLEYSMNFFKKKSGYTINHFYILYIKVYIYIGVK